MKYPIKTDIKNDVKIFYIEWELDESSSDDIFESVYNEILEENTSKNILNFEWVKYLNSRSIWNMLYLFSRVEKRDKELYISSCQENVKDILEIVGITSIIKVVDSEEEAIEKLS